MKRFLPMLLTLAMVVSMLPIYSLPAKAENPSDYTGPNDGEHAYLTLHLEEEDYSLYSMGEVDETFDVPGVAYDLESNTLTLDAFDDSSAVIEASEMGEDFTIEVEGENNIMAISAMADMYMNSVTITGTGTLVLNEELSYDDVPLFLNANNSASIIEIDDSVTFTAYSDEVSVKVVNSTSEAPIVAANTENKICTSNEETTQQVMVSAIETQENEFFGINDSDLYTTAYYDNDMEENVFCQYELIVKKIDGVDVTFAKQVLDEDGNYITVSEEDINQDVNVTACQLLSQVDKFACTKAGDDTRYAITQYWFSGGDEDGDDEGDEEGEGEEGEEVGDEEDGEEGEEGDDEGNEGDNEEVNYWDIHKILNDADLGTFFYPVEIGLTECPEGYEIQEETITNKVAYIEESFSNAGDVDIDDGDDDDDYDGEYQLLAKVKGSDCVYRDLDTIYMESGENVQVSFTVLDADGNECVPGWYSMDMEDAGFELAPEPVFDEDGNAYASITNNAAPEEYGTLIVNAFSMEKFEEGDFDWIETEPDETFEIDFASCEKFLGQVTVNDADTYTEGDTIELSPGEEYSISYEVQNYPGISIEGFDAEMLMGAGFECEQCTDDDDNVYAKVSTGTAQPGTTIVVPFHLYRFEDIMDHDWDFETTPKRYVYNMVIKVAVEDACEEHSYDEGEVSVPVTCTTDGFKIYTCTKCGDTKVEKQVATGHAYDGGVITTPATCVEDGVKTFTCGFCNETRFETVPMTGHSYDAGKITKAATCTTDGVKTFSCKNCDDVFMRAIKATGHKYDDGVVTTKATRKADGVITYTCANCAGTKTSKVAKISTVKLSTTKYVYSGTKKSPKVIVKDSAGNALVKGTDYTYTVPKGRKYVGKYSYKVTFKGKYSGSKTLSFVINPKPTNISSLTAISKGFTVKWSKRTTQTTGYQIKIATNSSFTKGVKTVTISKNTTVSKKLTKLLAKKKYYVKIRTYKTKSGVKYYSSWSAKKYVTTKK